jgi:hypothetical protein
MTFLTGQKWYCDSSKYSSVTQWAASTGYLAGNMVRQLTTPTVGFERVFVCTTAGTSSGTEPSWSASAISQGAAVTDNTATWHDVTGKAGVNGDLTDTTLWSSIKSTIVSVGVIIQRASGGSLQICTTSGTTGSGSEPSFSNTAGTTTTDNTVTWTSLGAPSNFAAWAAPFARLYPCFVATVFPSGTDTVYVGSGHAETQSSAAIAYNAPPSGLTVICVSNSASPPTATSTAGTVSTTGANNLAIGAGSSNYCYIYGLGFSAGSSSNAANLVLGDLGSVWFESCNFVLNTTSTSSEILFGDNATTSSFLELRNCTISFGATTQVCQYPSERCKIIGGSIGATGSIPTTLFSGDGAAGTGSEFRIMDCDLSALTGNLFNGASATGCMVSVENCKLNSSMTFVSASPNQVEGVFKHHNSDSANTNYKYAYYRFPGSVVSNTSITRCHGAPKTGQGWALQNRPW